MYNYPYGDNQQINLNWIISEIIALHQRLDPDYTAPTFTQIYPFSETQQLNLDWILTELKALKELAPTPAPTDAIDEVGHALIAGAYDADTQYQKNDYIVQDGKLYRANAATTGTFDPTKWREVMLGDDLAIITRWADATNTYLNNLAASNVSNDSVVAGDTVKDALGNLNGALSDEATARANTDAVLEDGLAIVMPTKQATQNLIYGDYVFVTADNKLYRMTNDCNQGNYIVVNTNCTVANTIAMPIRRYSDLTINIGESTPLTRITNPAAMILITFFRGGRVNFIAGQYAALRGNTIGTILNFGGANDTLTVKGDGTGLVITSSLSITSVLANIIEFVY